MKICHVTSAHKRKDGRIFQKECISLVHAGFDTYLVEEGDSMIAEGVHIVGLGIQPHSRVTRMFWFSRKAYHVALEINADVYHLHDPELIPYGLKLKKYGKKVIFDSHENILCQVLDKVYIPFGIRFLIDKFFRYYLRCVLPKFDCLISVTPHIVSALSKINSHTYQITNYPITKGIGCVDQSKYENITLCFTGGIDAQWNHKNIIEAISELHVDYVLCGRGEDMYIRELKECKGWRNVLFKGQVPYDEALDVQCKSHIGMALLSPSRNTSGTLGTIGNTKLFEYMMAGIPIICTNFKLWKNIIDKYQCGICVNPDNISEIHNAIIYLMDHPDEAKIMGENGRVAIEKEYNWETQELKLVEIYKQILQ